MAASHERQENAAQFVRRNADAGVGDFKTQRVAAAPLHAQRHAALPRKFNRIAEQIQQNLAQAALIALHNDGKARVFEMMKLQPFLLRPQPKHVHNHAQRVAQVELPRFNGEAAGLDFGQIQQIVDEMQQMIAAALNDFQPGSLLVRQAVVALQHLRIAENPVKRGAKFMAHVRQEFAFRPVRGFGGNRRLL